MPDFQIEREAAAQGYKAVAGLDEAGRGALFGPVVAAAVILPSRLCCQKVIGWVEKINDSKLLSPPKRKSSFREILQHAVSLGFGIVSNQEIDQNNIHWASLEAMRRAIKSMPTNPDFLLVDGFRLDAVNYSQRRIFQGDKKSISIAAASIIAKVLRDEMLMQLDQIYQGFALYKNKGYGTKEHYSALEEQGPTNLHRITFNLKKKKNECKNR